jgi:hypothetical protein
MILFVSYKQPAGAIWLSFHFMACVPNIYIQVIYCNGGRQSKWRAMDLGATPVEIECMKDHIISYYICM